MKINREELKKALEIVKPGLANKEIIEQTTSFAFIDGNVVTYNDEISICHPIPSLKLEGAIKAEEMYKYISKLSTDEIDLTIEESQIILKSGRSKVGFKLATEIVLPIEETLLKKEKWIKLPEDFINALSITTQSASKDMSDPKLTCVHINEEGYLEATDNYRVIRYNLIKKFPIETTLLPATSAMEVIKLNPIDVIQVAGWLHFKTKTGTRISCRTFSETFVDVGRILKNVKEGIHITYPEKIFDVLDKAQIFAQRKALVDETIEVSLKNGLILIKSENETSWFKESVPMKYTGEDVTFFITPYLLKDILKQTLKSILQEGRLIFKGDNWVYVTALRKD